MTNADVVAASMAAYRSQDAELAASLLAEDFRFTSPQDDGIDKAEWMRKCFPTADHFTSNTQLAIVELDSDHVFSHYEYELENGERYRNCEVLTVRDGQIVETQVYFGGKQPS